MNLKISEIFYSLQGETTWAGYPSLFIRLAGCNLDCDYCDTRYAREGGVVRSLDDIIADAAVCPTPHHVTVTGGEPLLQENVLVLMDRLLSLGYRVQLETNGSLSIRDVPRGVRKILDVKTPLSLEAASFLHDNLQFLSDLDEIKFVIAGIKDYNYAKSFMQKYLAGTPAAVSMSPVTHRVSPGELAGWILGDRLNVRLNLQLHKIIWPSGEPKTS